MPIQAEAIPGDFVVVVVEQDIMLEIPQGPVRISRTALSRHLEISADTWRLQVSQGGLAILVATVLLLLILH